MAIGSILLVAKIVFYFSVYYFLLIIYFHGQENLSLPRSYERQGARLYTRSFRYKLGSSFGAQRECFRRRPETFCGSE